MNTNELTERERSQIYLEMSKEAVRHYLCWKMNAKNSGSPTDDEVLTEWNRRFESTAQKFRHAD